MRNRIVQLNIRLTEDEHKKLISSTEKTKLSISSYIRSLINGNVPKECPPLEYHELISELQGISIRLVSILSLIKLTKSLDGVTMANLEKEMAQYRQILLAVQAAVLLPDKVI